jgi:hypothetical protein
MQFVQAANYTPTRGRVIDLIVLHSMEAPEKGDTAEATANYFARQRPGDKAGGSSAHYNVDNNSIVQSVHDQDVAWAAPGANSNGLHIEHAGYARQSSADWYDDYSQTMLRLSASLAAEKVKQYGLPVVFRRAADLLAGGARGRGITTHYEVTQAFHRSTHTDPGIGFVIDEYVGLINEYLNPKGVAMSAVTGAVDAALIPGWRTDDGRPGVWVLKDDGGVFAYPAEKNPPFFGSMGGKALNARMSGIVAYRSFDGALGYWLIGEDGGIFAFGMAPVVAPYAKFFDEYKGGAHGMVDAEFDGVTLTCIANDGATYQFRVK